MPINDHYCRIGATISYFFYFVKLISVLFENLDFTPTKKSAIMILTNIRKAGEKVVNEEMTRLELLTLLLSIKALLEEGKTEKALEIITEVIAEAKRNDK